MVAFYCVLIVADLYHVTLFTNNQHTYMGGDVAQLVRASDRHAADAGSIPQMRQEIFLPESTFSADSFTCRCGYMGVERTPNKSQPTKWILEKTILPPLLPGFELATFRSRVRRCNQQAIPASLSTPSCNQLTGWLF